MNKTFSKKIYLINPKSDTPMYFGGDVFKNQKYASTALLADLTILTVAAMIPKDFDVQICDENAEQIDFNSNAEFIGITGKISQSKRMKDIATRFRKKHKTIIIGGPYASLSPDDVRAYCDILVCGEIEEIADKLFSDLRNNKWKDTYIGTRPNPIISPVPKWELYPNKFITVGTLQTTRGCPFKCEFCDVTQYHGHKQRHKSIEQVLKELNELYKYNYRNVFLADDNLTSDYKYAKKLLTALKVWNYKQTEKVFFATQISIDATRNKSLIRLCAEAGVFQVFIGIETPDKAGLQQVNKNQNLNVNVEEAVNVFVECGIAVIGGIIIGFDTDDKNVFDKLYDFAMALPVPIWSFNALTAPNNTVLFHKMKKQNRLTNNATNIATPWDTNIIPKQMSKVELLFGIRDLIKRAYSFESFTERTINFIEKFGKKYNLNYRKSNMDNILFSIMKCLHNIGETKKMKKMFLNIIKALKKNPNAAYVTYQTLILYSQNYYMLQHSTK